LLFALALQPILRQLKEAHGNSGLDLVFGYLDDCVLAGNVDVVAAAFKEFREKAAAIGLKVALGRDKSLLVPCGRQACVFDRTLFPDRLDVQWDGNFDLLGSAIGDAAHC